MSLKTCLISQVEKARCIDDVNLTKPVVNVKTFFLHYWPVGQMRGHDTQHNNKRSATLSIKALNTMALNRACLYAVCHFVECSYAECHYDKCCYAECHYAEC